MQEQSMGSEQNIWKKTLDAGFEKHCREAIECGADVNCSDASPLGPPLVAAAREGLSKVVKVLLEHGAIPDFKGRSDGTALFEAASRNAYSICEMLLEAGADPNSVAKFGSTPLIAAAANGYVSICQLLVNHGALVDLGIPVRGTALLVALNNHKFAAASRLVKLGADPGFMPERANDLYRTPFMLAASCGDAALVCEMIDSGRVDPLRRPDGAPTAAQLAAKYPEALEAILTYQTQFEIERATQAKTAGAADDDQPADVDGGRERCRPTGLSL
jgi:ankyrin repeat protein